MVSFIDFEPGVLEKAQDCFAEEKDRLVVLAIGVTWSPASRQVLEAVAELRLEAKSRADAPAYYLMNADEALAYATRCQVVAGAACLKLFYHGSELQVWRGGVPTYSVVHTLSAGQVRAVVREAHRALAENDVIQIDF